MEHHQPDELVLPLFREEERLTRTLNGSGKVRNDLFFKRALLDTWGHHFRPNRFSLEEEGRILEELASDPAVSSIEVLVEKWDRRPVPDFRVTPDGGPPYLVEIKTISYLGETGEVFRRKFLERLAEAAHQIQSQAGSTGETRNRILVVLHAPEDHPLPKNLQEELEQGAVLFADRSPHLARVDVRFRTG